MKKIISIFFISIYLISFTEFREILKLPEFVEHYKEHKRENINTTVFSFVVLHYFSGNINDADYKQDMKLPFKAHDFSCFNYTIQDLPKIVNLNIPLIKEFKENHSNFYYAFSFSTLSVYPTFQPPELV